MEENLDRAQQDVGDAPDEKESAGVDEARREPFAVFPDRESFMARLKREAKREVANIAKQLGFDSPDALLEYVRAVKDEEQRKKSEEEKLRERLGEYERALAERELELAEARRQQALVAAAMKHGVSDIEAAYRLIDWAEVDTGDAKGVEEAVKKLLSRYPWLRSARQVGGPTPTGGEAAHLTREQIEAMTPEEINRNWDRIQEALKRGFR